MFSSVLVLSALLSSTTPKVLVLDLRALDVDASTASLINGVVASAAAAHKELAVTSADDVRQMLSLAAQKQAVGCDETSCLSEIAGAIGARYVLHGNLGKLGGTVLVNLALFDAQNAVAVDKRSLQAASLEQVPALLPAAVDALLAAIPGAHAPSSSSAAIDAHALDAHPSPRDRGSAAALMTPAGIGLAALSGLAVVGGGALAGVEAAAVYDVAHKSPQQREDALGATWLGLLLAGAGVVGVGAGVVVAVIGGS